MALNPQTGKYALETPIREFTNEETEKWREGDVCCSPCLNPSSLLLPVLREKAGMSAFL